jgi:alkylation response protein AidB-like acyl-CoA dehydrogenase
VAWACRPNRALRRRRHQEIPIEFGLDAAQRQFDAALRAFNKSAVGLDRVRAVAQTGFDAALWRELQTLGVPALRVPEAQGGLGLGLLDASVAAEALGSGSVPAPFAAVAVMAPDWVQGAASAAQQAEWLPRIASGEMRVAVALDALDGAAVRAPSMSAQGLTGRVGSVLDADGATHFLVLLGDGRTALVAADGRGVGVQARAHIDRTRSLADIRFDAAPAVLLEAATDPCVLARRVRDAGRIVLAADAIGAAQHMLDSAVAWAGERVQFGRLIGSFQGLKHTLAEAVTLLEPCRALLWQAAHAHDRHADDAPLLACHLKAHVGDVTREVARMTTEVHGGMGFTDLLGLHYWFKRCAFDRQFLGAPAQCRDEAAALQGWTAALPTAEQGA